VPLPTHGNVRMSRTEAVDPRAAWPLYPLYPLIWLIVRLPQRGLLWLGGALAVLGWPLLGRRRRIAARNIALCFPELDEPARSRLLRANLRATVIGLLEMLRAWFAPDAALRGLYRIEGLQHLLAAREQGRGVLLLSAHFTCIELACRMLNVDASKQATMLVRRYDWKPLEAMIDHGRRAHAGQTLEKKDVAGLLRELKSGGDVLYGGDQDFSSQNVFVPFFGIPTSTLATTPRIVQRARAVMLPMWCRREPDGRYLLNIGAPWENWPSDDPGADAARYMRELEREIRKAPEQYLWVHRRFKTRPEGEASLYD